MADRIPVCPGCGAKFSHDREKARCRACGIPDEVAAIGKDAIEAWQEQTLENKRLFGRMHARQQHTADGKPARPTGKSKNKHGRNGVQLMVQDEVEPWLANVKRARKEQRAQSL